MARPDDAVRAAPRRRRVGLRPAVLAAGAAALVLVGAVELWPPPPPPSSPVARHAPPAAAVPPAGPVDRSGTVASAVPGVAPARAPRVAASTAPRPAPPAPDAVDDTEVCGLGRVRPDDAHAEPIDLLPAAVRALAWQQVDLALATDNDPKARAAAHLVRVRRHTAAPAWRDAAEADQACRDAARMGMVETAAFCIGAQQQRQAELLAPIAGDVGALARLALVSADPQVLAYAREACAPHGLTLGPRPPDCALLDAARWQQAAPDEAEPRLAQAVEAQARADDTAADAALARALLAPRWDAHAGRLAATVASLLTERPDGVDAAPAPRARLRPLEQTAVLAGLAALADGAGGSTAAAAVGALCADAHLQRPARRRDCDALARQMIDHGRAAATVEAGLGLAERLGWPADRTGAAWRRHRATLEAVRTWRQAGPPLGCDRLQRERRHALATGRDGDLGAARRLVAAGRAARADEAVPRAPDSSVNFTPCPARTSNCLPPPATPTSASRR